MTTVLEREESAEPTKPRRLSLRRVALGPLVRQHWPFLVLLAAGIALRLVASLAFWPIVPFRNRDSYEYLRRALEMSATGGFHPFLYSTLLRVLTLGGSLAPVTMVQHLAGLAMGGLLYALLRRRGAGPVLGALGVSPVLIDGFQLAFEHQILSETFCQLFVVCGLVLLTWRGRPSLVHAGGGGLLLGVSVLVRFVGLGTMVPALLYSVVRRMGWARIASLVLSFVLPLAVYAVWFKSDSGSLGITNRNGFYLYGRTASFADCREVSVAPELRVFCPPPGGPPGRGLFKSGLPDEIRRDPSYNGRALAFAKQMIAAKPLAYVSAVLWDFARYFTVSDEFKKSRNQWRFPHAIRSDRRMSSGLAVQVGYRPGLAAFLHDYQSVVHTWGPLLAALFLVGAVGGVIGWGNRAAGAPAPEALLFTFAAVGMMLFATMFAVYHFRYVLVAIPLSGPATILGVVAARNRMAGRRLAAQGRPEPEAVR
jgi:hypothetical protein